MPTFYICNEKLIEEKLETLVKKGMSDDGWRDYYFDENTTEEWELTRHDSEYHGGGIAILKKLPPPSVRELIEIALTSRDLNDVTGASIELSEREKYNNENFREELLNKLMAFVLDDIDEFDAERIKIIIDESDLSDPTNRREIVGKHHIDIMKDAEFYRSVSEKAKLILEKVKGMIDGKG